MSAITIETRLSDVVDYPTREQHGRFYVNDFRRSLAQLDEYLSRPATIGDMTVTTVDGFKLYLVGRGYRPTNVTKNITFIRRIWKQLHSRLPDVVSPQVTMRQKQPPRVPREPIPLTSISPKTSIRAAFDSLELDPKYRGRSYVSKCRWSIAQFDRMLGRLSTLSDLNSATVDRFAAFLGATFKASTTRSRATILRRVWRWVWSKYPEHVATPPMPDCRPKTKPVRRRAIVASFPEPADPAERKRVLSCYFEDVFWPMKIGRSRRTKTMYLLTIRVFCRWLGRLATLNDLNELTLCKFLQYRIESVSAHSAVKDRFNLMAIASYAAKKRAIPEFLDVPPISAALPAPKAYRPEEFCRLMAACRSARGMIAGVPANAWWTALHCVLLFTGERIGATLALEWTWLTADGWLTVPARVRKGGKKSKTYRLPGVAMRWVDKLRSNGSERIFGTPWVDAHRTGAFYYRYNKLLDAALLPKDRRCKPHKIRATFATAVKMLGGNPTDELSHDDPKTTQRYIDETMLDAPQFGEKIANLFDIFAPVREIETEVEVSEEFEITDSLPLATLIR